MINIIVVDDQRLVYEGFQSMLNMVDGLSCERTFKGGQDFIDAWSTEEISCDVVLMDIRMPGLNGIEATAQLKKMNPEVHVLMLTTFNDRSYIIEAMKAGANGYVLKDVPFEKLIEAIHSVYETGAYLLDSVTRSLIDYVREIDQDQSAQIETWQGKYQLTKREKEVMHWIKKGLANHEIARELHISEGTVKNHVSNIMDKVDLRERHHLIIYALSGERPD